MMKKQIKLCLLFLLLIGSYSQGFASNCSDLKDWVTSQVPGGDMVVNLVDSDTYSFTIKNTTTSNSGVDYVNLYINGSNKGTYQHGNTVNLTLVPGQTISVKLKYHVYVWHRWWPHTCENSWDSKTIKITYQPVSRANDYEIGINPITCGNDENLILSSDYSYFTDQVVSVSWSMSNDAFDPYQLQENKLAAKLIKNTNYNENGTNMSTVSATITLNNGQVLSLSKASSNIILNNDSTVKFGEVAYVPIEEVYSNISAVEFDKDDTTDDHLYFSNRSKLARYAWDGTRWILKTLDTPGGVRWKWSGENKNIEAIEDGENVKIFYIDSDNNIRYATYNQEGELTGNNQIISSEAAMDYITTGTNNGFNYIVGYSKESRYMHSYIEDNNGNYIHNGKQYWINTGAGAVTVGNKDQSQIALIKSSRVYIYEVTNSGFVYKGYKYSPTGAGFNSRVTSAHIKDDTYMIYFKNNERHLKMFTYDINTGYFGTLTSIELAYNGTETVVKDFAVDKKTGDLYYIANDNKRLYNSRNIAQNEEEFEYKDESHYLIEKFIYSRQGITYTTEYTSNGLQFTFANSHLYFLDKDENNHNILFNTWYDEGCTPVGEEALRTSTTSMKTIADIDKKEEMSLEVMNTEMSLKLFPNPAVDVLNVSFGLNKISDASLNIYSSTGKLINQYDYKQLDATIHQKQIDVSSYNQGLYLVILNTENGTKTSKLIIK